MSSSRELTIELVDAKFKRQRKRLPLVRDFQIRLMFGILDQAARRPFERQ
jgi:hypothetical protein